MIKHRVGVPVVSVVGRVVLAGLARACVHRWSIGEARSTIL